MKIKYLSLVRCCAFCFGFLRSFLKVNLFFNVPFCAKHYRKFRRLSYYYNPWGYCQRKRKRFFLLGISIGNWECSQPCILLFIKSLSTILDIQVEFSFKSLSLLNEILDVACLIFLDDVKLCILPLKRYLCILSLLAQINHYFKFKVFFILLFSK